MESVDNTMTQTEYVKIKNKIFELQSEQDFSGVDNSKEIEELKKALDE